MTTPSDPTKSAQAMNSQATPLGASAQEGCNATCNSKEDSTDKVLSDFILRPYYLPTPGDGGHESEQTSEKGNLFTLLPDFTQQAVYILSLLIDWWEKVRLHPPELGARAFYRLVSQPLLNNASPRKDLSIPIGWLKEPSSPMECQLCRSVLALEEQMFRFTQLTSVGSNKVARTIFSVSEMNTYLDLYSTDIGRKFKSLKKLTRTADAHTKCTNALDDLLNRFCASVLCRTNVVYGSFAIHTFQMRLSHMILSVCESVNRLASERSVRNIAQPTASQENTADPQVGKGAKASLSSARPLEMSSERLSVDELLRFTIINMFDHEAKYEWCNNMMQDYWRTLPHESCPKKF